MNLKITTVLSIYEDFGFADVRIKFSDQPDGASARMSCGTRPKVR